MKIKKKLQMASSCGQKGSSDIIFNRNNYLSEIQGLTVPFMKEIVKAMGYPFSLSGLKRAELCEIYLQLLDDLKKKNQVPSYEWIKSILRASHYPETHFKDLVAPLMVNQGGAGPSMLQQGQKGGVFIPKGIIQANNNVSIPVPARPTVPRAFSPTKEARGPSAYNEFMRNKLPGWKQQNPYADHKQAFEAVAAMWHTSPENPNRRYPPQQQPQEQQQQVPIYQPQPQRQKRNISDYNEYMKRYLPGWKNENPEADHKQAFEAVGQQWKTSPENPINFVPRGIPLSSQTPLNPIVEKSPTFDSISKVIFQSTHVAYSSKYENLVKHQDIAKYNPYYGEEPYENDKQKGFMKSQIQIIDKNGNTHTVFLFEMYKNSVGFVYDKPNSPPLAYVEVGIDDIAEITSLQKISPLLINVLKQTLRRRSQLYGNKDINYDIDYMLTLIPVGNKLKVQSIETSYQKYRTNVKGKQRAHDKSD